MNFFYKYIKSLILQLITFHDYESLKIAVFTNKFSELNKIKNLNHCWNDDRSFRFFATNSIEAENVSSELTKILMQQSINNVICNFHPNKTYLYNLQFMY